MKIRVETIVGCGLDTEIEFSDTPMDILTGLYNKEPEEAKMYFSGICALEQFLSGVVDELGSKFLLFKDWGDHREAIATKWHEPLSNQPEIMKELLEAEKKGDVPVFITNIRSFV